MAKVQLHNVVVTGSIIRSHKDIAGNLFVCVNDCMKVLGYSHGGASPYISRMKRTHVLERGDVDGGIKNYAKFTSVPNLLRHLDKHCQKPTYGDFRSQLFDLASALKLPF